MTLRATATDEPYTLSGIITKLIDTAISQEEGLHDPDVMSGWWKHSGVRIYWSCHVRGKVTQPLLIKLVRELKRHKAGGAALSPQTIEGLQRLVSYSIQSSDRYAVQNLAILADEYQLAKSEREMLINTFFDRQIKEEQFQSLVFEDLLRESGLQESIRQGRVPSACYVTLYSKDDNDNPKFDSSTFLAYRNAAMQRQDLLRELGLEHDPFTGISYPVGEIISLYDLRKAA